MNKLRIGLAAAFATAAVAGVTASDADAHATLQATEPLRGATLDAQPERVVFRFNEPVELNFGAIDVYDAGGNEVDDGKVVHPGGKASDVAVGLQPGIADGTFTATFRVISADGHPVSGGFVFVVGAPGAAPTKSVSELTAMTTTGKVTRVSFMTARAVQYGAIALAIGVLVFLLGPWFAGLREVTRSEAEWREASEAFVGRARLLLGIAVGAGLLSGAAGIVLQGATAAGVSVGSALRPEVVQNVVETRFGAAWALRLVVWALLGVALGLAFRRHDVPFLRSVALSADGLALGRRFANRPFLVLSVALLPLLAVSPAFAGHAREEDPGILLIPSNFVHVAAISVWTGGLAALVFALPAATRRLAPVDRSRLLAAVVSRFSTIAGLSVALVLATGIVQSLFLVGNLDNLLHTNFGHATLVKIALFVMLMGLGGLNRQVSVPRLKRVAAGGEPPGGAGRLLRRAVTAEVTLVVAVLGATGALATYAPSTSIESSGPYAETQTIGPAEVQLTIDPAQVGRNLAHLYLIHPVDGRQYDEAKEVDVTLSQPDKDIGPLETVSRKAGPGHYVLDNAVFGVDGEWEVQVSIRVTEFDAYDGTFEVRIR